MAVVASPYGLRPINLQGGQVMTHGIRLLKITPGYATSIFNGDLVKLAVGGTIEKDTGTATALPVGVFLGVEYEDPSMGLLHRQLWPAGQVIKTGTNALAYVVDDPDTLFEIQASGSLGQNCVGCNAGLIQTAGITATGKSKVALDVASIAAAATLPLRIVDYIRRPGSTLGDAYTDVIVRINTHFNRSALGIAPA